LHDVSGGSRHVLVSSLVDLRPAAP
jgi:hypothetical protein